jgi:hypothetical protein
MLDVVTCKLLDLLREGDRGDIVRRQVVNEEELLL